MNSCPDWRYYNHALIPNSAPHKTPNADAIKNCFKLTKKEKIRPLLVRWTTDFDCGFETGWWYIIKDKPFDISTLKSKRRYEINKGNSNFIVHTIDPKEYFEELYKVQIEAFSAYPESYRPKVDYEAFIKDVNNWYIYDVFGAFSKETNELCGYALLNAHEEYIEFNVLKTKPSTEKLSINAAIVSNILDYYKYELEHGIYICDGSRNIMHETAFQDYLEKYFGFRKAYCIMHVKYLSFVGIMVKILYPFRKFFAKIDKKLFKQIVAVLKMEEINRMFKERKNNE